MSTMSDLDASTQDQESHDSYITTTRGMSGWFAVMMWWNDREPDLGGFWEPYDTGIGRYQHKTQAEDEARHWADTTGLQFKP